MYSRVYVEITNICNRACSFCHGHTRPPRRMSEAEFCRVLAALNGQTSYIYYHLMGEPLTHPDLPRFLTLAREAGFHSIITTNGTLLAARGEELLRAGLYKVNISLHSMEGEDVRAAEECYLDEVITFAEAAAAAGTKIVFRLWNRGADGGRNEDTLAYLRAHLTGEWQENTRGLRIRPGMHLEFGDRFQWPDMAAPIMGEQFFCYGLADHFGILSDGRVVPCCLDSEGTITLGNAFTEPLTDILSSPRANAIREGFAVRRASEELCRRCGYARRFIRS